MSRAERVAAMCGVAIAGVLAVAFHVATLGWLTGLVTGWLLCTMVNRSSRKQSRREGSEEDPQ